MNFLWSFFLICLLCIGGISYAKPLSPENNVAHESLKNPSLTKSPEERLRNLADKIFMNSLEPKSQNLLCKTLKPQKLYDYSNYDTAFQSKLHEFLNAFEQQDENKVRSFFHPRLPIKKSELRSIFADMQAIYGKKLTLTIYKVLALRSNSDASVSNLLPCDETTELAIRGQYGYPLQLAVILQVSGTKELGRIFVDWVPSPSDSWSIGAFHLWQWTHQQKDPQAWTEDALIDHREKRDYLAFLKIDLAQKLYLADPFVEFAARKDLLAVQNDLLKKTTLIDRIKTQLQPYQIAYVGSALTPGGVSPLLRFRLEKEISSKQTKEYCRDAFVKIKALSKEFNQVPGLYCGFIFPAEDPTSDGLMGGFYLPAP